MSPSRQMKPSWPFTWPTWQAASAEIARGGISRASLAAGSDNAALENRSVKTSVVPVMALMAGLLPAFNIHTHAGERSYMRHTQTLGGKSLQTTNNASIGMSAFRDRQLRRHETAPSVVDTAQACCPVK